MTTIYVFSGEGKHCYSEYHLLAHGVREIPIALQPLLLEENHHAPTGSSGVVLHWFLHRDGVRTLAVFVADGRLCIAGMAGLSPNLKVNDEVYLRIYREDIPLLGIIRQNALRVKHGPGPHRITDISPTGDILLENFEERITEVQVYAAAEGEYKRAPAKKPSYTSGGVCFQIPYDTKEIHKPTDSFKPGMMVTHKDWGWKGEVKRCSWKYVEVALGTTRVCFEPYFLRRT